jgi:hypothetical protein
VYFRIIIEIKKQKYSTQKNNKYTHNLFQFQGSVNIDSSKFIFENLKKKSVL